LRLSQEVQLRLQASLLPFQPKPTKQFLLGAHLSLQFSFSSAPRTTTVRRVTSPLLTTLGVELLLTLPCQLLMVDLQFFRFQPVQTLSLTVGTQQLQVALQ
jgi:hypothetical protein